MKETARQSNPIEYERNLKAEQLKVSEAQAVLNEGGFVPLAEAARQAQVPLSTLAHAVRHMLFYGRESRSFTLLRMTCCRRSTRPDGS